MSHTPGPWLNAGRSAGAHIHADSGEVAWLRSYVGISDEEIAANACLIEAAPDLLEALVYAAELLEYGGFDMEKVDKAIAKARGLSS